jgi:hypothetical protein
MIGYVAAFFTLWFTLCAFSSSSETSCSTLGKSHIVSAALIRAISSALNTYSWFSSALENGIHCVNWLIRSSMIISNHLFVSDFLMDMSASLTHNHAFCAKASNLKKFVFSARLGAFNLTISFWIKSDFMTFFSTNSI